MLFGRRTGTAQRPWRVSAKLLIASSVATVIGFSAICAGVMLDMRRGEEALARQSLENLASSIDADISRNIEVYDLSLRAVASSMVLPEIKHVARTNFCDIGWRVDGSGRVIIVSVIDNLLKGASGQAVQNFNVMLGMDETTGLL